MGTEALVALVLSVTQVAKSWLQNWFKQIEWKAWMSVVLSLLVTAGVVLYDALKNGVAVNLDLIWIMVYLHNANFHTTKPPAIPSFPRTNIIFLKDAYCYASFVGYCI